MLRLLVRLIIPHCTQQTHGRFKYGSIGYCYPFVTSAKQQTNLTTNCTVNYKQTFVTHVHPTRFNLYKIIREVQKHTHTHTHIHTQKLYKYSKFCQRFACIVTVVTIQYCQLKLLGRACSIYGGEGVYRVLVGKPEGKRPLERPRSRWENNIKMDLQEVG